MTPSTDARPGRNQPCYCGSGKKYKQCCLSKDEEAAAAARAKAAEEAEAAAAEEAPADGESEGEAVTASPTARPRTNQPWKVDVVHPWARSPAATSTEDRRQLIRVSRPRHIRRDGRVVEGGGLENR